MGWGQTAVRVLDALAGGWEDLRRRREERRKAELEAWQRALERRLELAGDIGVHFAEAMRKGDLAEMHRLNEQAERAGLGPKR